MPALGWRRGQARLARQASVQVSDVARPEGAPLQFLFAADTDEAPCCRCRSLCLASANASEFTFCALECTFKLLVESKHFAN